MSTNFSHGRDNQDNQTILQAYGVLSALHAVETHQASQTQKPVLINDILAYIKGRTNQETQRVEGAITSNLNVRRQYKQLLRVNPIGRIDKPRAAHSAMMFEMRIGDQGVCLKLKQSKGHQEQYYLILELPETFSAVQDKTLVLHANTDTKTQRAVFPPMHDRRSQIILSAGDPLFSLLQDHDVEIDIQ